jgi:hypothetical protein
MTRRHPEQFFIRPLREGDESLHDLYEVFALTDERAADGEWISSFTDMSAAVEEALFLQGEADRQAIQATFGGEDALDAREAALGGLVPEDSYPSGDMDYEASLRDGAEALREALEGDAIPLHVGVTGGPNSDDAEADSIDRYEQARLIEWRLVTARCRKALREAAIDAMILPAEEGGEDPEALLWFVREVEAKWAAEGLL